MRRIIAATSLLLAASVALSGCASAATAEKARPSWSYGADTGPAQWQTLDPACSTTRASRQSPVDIDTSTLAIDPTAAPVVLHDRPASFELGNDGHMIVAVADDPHAYAITIAGTRYDLRELDFHAGSEHELDGRPAAAELQLVHVSSTGAIAVMSVLFRTGAANAALDEVFSSMPHPVTVGTDRVDLTEPIDPAALIPPGSTSARYIGSLTSPPCTADVLWNVYLHPLTVSPAQLHDLTDIYSDNHRPVQPLNGRTITGIAAG
ncbi:carbonic anhydrase [Leifsonia poae]|uniref:carbonic anhydrase n=1 Tax=Leifsonia poae TaxID=110933 RepID=UPI001CC0C23D|nr:carbonic anhydrase family protein [Leifsonia poae]